MTEPTPPDVIRRVGGRRPPKHAPSLELGPFLTGTVPAHPTSVDYLAQVSDWGLYGNSEYGDCGPAAVGNDRKLITRDLGGAERSPTLADVLDLYRRSGNPGFDPDDPGGPGDQGVDLQTMLEQLVKGGIGGVKAIGFARVRPGNLDELRAAVAIFGSVLLGVDLKVAQQTQTDVWDYSPSPDWGGHAVIVGDYSSAPTGADLGGISWAKPIGMTDRFLLSQLEEAWVIIWPEHLGSKEFQQGVNLASLAIAYTALTGRDFPAPTPTPPAPGPGPAPVPTPVPTPSPGRVVDAADIALAQAFDAWTAARGIE